MKQVLSVLLEISLYSAIITGAVLLFQRLFRKSISARLQFLCWGLLILRLMLPVTFESGLHLDALLPEVAPAASNAPNASTGNEGQSASPNFVDRVQAADGADIAPPSAPASAETNPGGAPSAAAKRPVDWYALAFYAWLTGIALTLAWFIFAKHRFIRRAQKSAVPADRNTLTLFTACKLCAQVKGGVALVVTGEKLSPSLAMLGLRPVVILPATLTGEPSTLRYAMLHELSHCKRGDHIVLTLCALLRCAYWFNPVVWLAFALMQSDMESACDARVLSLIAPREKRSYLVTLLSLFTRNRQMALGMAEYHTKRLAKKRVEDAFMNARTGHLARLAAAALSLALLISCFTTACQPTPQEEIVVNKGDDKTGEAIGGTAAPIATTAAPEATPEPVYWNGEYVNGTGSVKITANALVVTPNVAAYPVYRVDPCADFSQEFVDAVHEQLLGGCELVNASKEMTRAEAESAYLKACQRLAELQEKGIDALSVVADGNTLEEQLEEEIGYAKDDIERYGALMETAPESVPDAYIEPDAFRVMDEYGGYGFSAIPQIGEYGRRVFSLYNGSDGSQGRDWASNLFVMLGAQYYRTTAYAATDKDWQEWYSLSGAEREIPFAELPKVLDMTEEAAQAWALNALIETGFSHGLRVVKCGQYGLGDTGASDGREENNYAWLLTLEPVIGGIPVFHEVFRFETDPYETAYYYPDEEITLAVNDTGLHELSVIGYFSVGEQLNANVALVDVETIKERIAQQLLLESAYWDEQNMEGTLEIVIEKIELGYGRTVTKDDPAGQMLIPMWNVYCTYKSPGQEPYYMDFPALTLNAIDGSRM